MPAYFYHPPLDGRDWLSFSSARLFLFLDISSYHSISCTLVVQFRDCCEIQVYEIWQSMFVRVGQCDFTPPPILSHSSPIFDAFSYVEPIGHFAFWGLAFPPPKFENRKDCRSPKDASQAREGGSFTKACFASDRSCVLRGPCSGDRFYSHKICLFFSLSFSFTPFFCPFLRWIFFATLELFWVLPTSNSQMWGCFVVFDRQFLSCLAYHFTLIPSVQSWSSSPVYVPSHMFGCKIKRKKRHNKK